MAFRSRNFHAMYLAAGSCVFAGDTAEPHSPKLLRSSTKEQPSHVKELITNKIRMFSFLAKIIQ